MKTKRVFVAGLVVALGTLTVLAQDRQSPDAPRPIGAGESVWAEGLTFMEIRDAVRSGTTTVIVGTGGIEQNGPYVAGGKHNFVLQTVLPYIARAIGPALIAPIVKFVPEGSIEPTPSGHMAYAGTISVEPETFEVLLTDICRSYKAHGFVDIVLLGDSGGNQTGMERVADTLNRRWSAERVRVHYLREYYFEDQWSWNYLKSLGVAQIDRTAPPGQSRDRPTDWRNGIHDDIYYEAQIAVQDSKLIRMEQPHEGGAVLLAWRGFVPDRSNGRAGSKACGVPGGHHCEGLPSVAAKVAAKLAARRPNIRMQLTHHQNQRRAADAGSLGLRGSCSVDS